MEEYWGRLFGSDLTKLIPCMKLRQMSLQFRGLEPTFRTSQKLYYTDLCGPLSSPVGGLWNVPEVQDLKDLLRCDPRNTGNL